MKKLVLILTCCLFSGIVFSNSIFYSINDTQVIQNGHWIYEAFYKLSLENKKVLFLETQPMSVGELKFNLQKIDRAALSQTGQELYDSVYVFLYSQKNLFKTEGFKFYTQLNLNPEAYYKYGTDNEYKNPTYIDWSFDYFYKDNPVTLPLIFGISNYFTIESDLYAGKNFGASNQFDNFTNIPIQRNTNEFEFTWPRFAYGSTGLYFDSWGINLTIAKEGLTIGQTQTGSILYNKTFETDCYVQLNVFADNFKYSLDTVQIEHEKILYLHQVNYNPFENLHLSLIEGSLVKGSFDLRFLNPLMIMHSYNAWLENVDADKEYYYSEDNFCAYFGFTFEYVPVNFLRIYGLYAQNEIQTESEKNTGYGAYRPDSLGFQLGFEMLLPSKNSGYWKAALEGVYASPYLYVKQTPDCSLFRQRLDNLNYVNNTFGRYVCSWIGSPLGPDSFGINAKASYEKTKWSAGFYYRFIVHGENSFGLFYDEANYDKTLGIFIYYPFVKAKIAAKNNDDAALKEAYNLSRSMWMSGEKVYLNQFAVEGRFAFTEQFSVCGKILYNLLYQTNDAYDLFAHGLEFDVAFTYLLDLHRIINK